MPTRRSFLASLSALAAAALAGVPRLISRERPVNGAGPARSEGVIAPELPPQRWVADDGKIVYIRVPCIAYDDGGWLAMRPVHSQAAYFADDQKISRHEAIRLIESGWTPHYEVDTDHPWHV